MIEKLAIIIPHLNYSGVNDLLGDFNEQENIVFSAFIVNNGDLKFKGLTWLNFAKNQGVARSWNIGLNKAIEGGYVNFLWFNDDVRITDKSFLANCLKIIQNGDVVCAGQQITGSGWCFGYNIDIVNKVGEFDERFFPCFWEDNDINTRLINVNAKFVTVNGIEHKASSTTNTMSCQNYLPIMEETYRVKWQK